LKPERSGGGFDPMGCRQADILQADRIPKVTEHLGGRWLFVTLTVRRDVWLHGPEQAYRAGQTRVKRVCRALGSYFFVALEVQGRTGDGWPHWHCLIRLDDQGMSIEAARAAVLRRWRVVHEQLNRETGEVQRMILPMGAPQAQDVQEVRDVGGAGVYVSKYVTKAWKGVPSWMGESRRQIRKVRCSVAVFDELERMQEHTRQRGTRRIAGRARRPARILFERMARSGACWSAFEVEPGGVYRFVGRVWCPVSEVGSMIDRLQGRPLRFGLGTMRVAVEASRVRACRAHLAAESPWAQEVRRYVEDQAEHSRRAFAAAQREGRSEAGGTGGLDGDGGGVADAPGGVADSDPIDVIDPSRVQPEGSTHSAERSRECVGILTPGVVVSRAWPPVYTSAEWGEPGRGAGVRDPRNKNAPAVSDDNRG
jgi:hypothetical protein